MKKLFISLLAIFLIACGNNSSSTTPTSSSAAEPEPNINDEPMQTETNNEPKNDEAQMGSIDEILKEFPDGILSFLSKKERNCLDENAPFELLRQIELDLYAGRPFSEDAIKYFDMCNIPPPPLPGEGESDVQAFPEGNVSENVEENAYLVDIVSLNQDGVSPHLEVVNSTTLRLFYSSLSANGLAVDLCDYDLNCTRQGAIERIQDLTIVETTSGTRRGYFVEFNPNTKSKEIMTAIFSEDGLSYTNQISLGISDGGSIAWGVPDAVVIPDGRIRIYWVDESSGMRGEKIVSATSETPEGISFTKDPGYRFENGYVDFEVLVAEENNWKAIFSFSPEGLPKIPQSLFVATSKDGLEWDFTGVPISPLDLSSKNALKKAKRLPCGCYFCFITLLAVAQSTKGSLITILIDLRNSFYFQTTYMFYNKHHEYWRSYTF